MLIRVPVLRCKTIADRNNDCRQFSGQPAAKNVVNVLVGGEEDESTAVKEDDYREIFYGLLCGDKYSEPELASGIYDDVVRLDAVDGFGRRRGPEVYEFEDTAVHGAISPANCCKCSRDYRKQNPTSPGQGE